MICLALLLGCAYDPTESEETKKLEVFAFSVGKADALLVRTSDVAIMIDTGENGDGDDLLKMLSSLGVEKLDLLILTHFDKDHIGGADTLIRNLPVDRILLPSYEKEETKQYQQLRESLDTTSAVVSWLDADETITFGEMMVSVWVSPVPFDGKSDNEQSLITKLLYDGRTYLFMGDAEGEELKKLVYSGRNLTCDVLKLPHHGVYDDQLPALLTVTMPQYVIICDSEKNPAGSETMKTLAFFDTTVLQTKDGDIHLIAAQNVLKSQTNKTAIPLMQSGIFLILQDIIGDAVVPVYVGFTVYRNPFIFGKQFGPRAFIVFQHPIAAVEASPQDRTSVSVEILFADDAFVVRTGIDDANRVIRLSVDQDLTAPDDVQHEWLFCGAYDASVLSDQPFRHNMRFVSAVILAEPPVLQKPFAVQKCVQFLHAVFLMAFRKVSAVRIR